MVFGPLSWWALISSRLGPSVLKPWFKYSVAEYSFQQSMPFCEIAILSYLLKAFKGYIDNVNHLYHCICLESAFCQKSRLLLIYQRKTKRTLIENAYMHEYCVSLQVQLVSLHFLDSSNFTIIPENSSNKSPNSCLEAHNALSSSAWVQHWLPTIAVLVRTSHELWQFK